MQSSGISFPEALSQSSGGFDGYAEFRNELIRTGDVSYITAGTTRARVVIEQNYLTAREKTYFRAELSEALVEVPELLGRRLVSGSEIVTIYVYDIGKADRPVSTTAKFSDAPNSWGIMLAYVKEGRAPLFHEVAHLSEPAENFTRDHGSVSLSEGLAEWVEAYFCPGKAHGFTPADADADALAVRYIQKYPRAFVDGIGEPEPVLRFSSQDVRIAFSLTSWSFVKFLVANYGLSETAALVADGGTSYERRFGKSLHVIREQWLRSLERGKEPFTSGNAAI